MYNFDVITDFVDWLNKTLNDLGWSNSELAKRMEMAPSTISMIISRQSNPGWEFCAKLAKALGESPLVIFYKAGLLSEPKKGEKEEDLLHNYRALTQAHQKFIVDIMRGLVGVPTIREASAPYQAGPAPPVPDAEDIMDLFQHLDPYHQRTVYDFSRWTLEQQSNPYDSDLKRQQEWQRRYNIGMAELIEIVHNLPTEEYEKILNFLLSLKANREHNDSAAAGTPDKTRNE